MHASHCTLYTVYGDRVMEKTAIALGFHSSNRSEKGGCRIAIQLFNQTRLCEMLSNDLVNCSQKHSSFSHFQLIAHFIKK